MKKIDISCSRNFSSEIYEKMKKTMYLTREISQARYMKKWKKLIYLARGISQARCIQKIKKLIYLAREISRARYMKKWKNWYILLKKFLEWDISKMGLVDISRLSNYSSEIYQKWICLIYLARVIIRARNIKIGFWWYILLK